MADINGIMAQINALRGSYGGAYGPNSVVQPTSGGGVATNPGLLAGTNNGSLPPGMSGISGFNPTPPQLNLGSPGNSNPFSGGGTYSMPMGGNNAPARQMPLPTPMTPQAPDFTMQSFYDPANYNPVPRTLPENANFTSGMAGTVADPARMNQRLGLLPAGANLASNAVFGSLTPAMGWKPTIGDMAKAWGATGTDPTQQFLNRMPNLSAGKQQRFAQGGWDKMGEQIMAQMLQLQNAGQRNAKQGNRGQRRDINEDPGYGLPL